MPGFEYKGNKYPVNEYKIDIRGDLVGMSQLGTGQSIEQPKHYNTYWGKASVQEVVDDLANLLFTGGGASLDPDATNVINSMVDPTELQKTAINNFIIASKAAGNWALMDDFACGSLGDVTASNGLLKWKSLAQMVAFGGTTIDINGWNFNGTNAYLDSDYNPSVDGINYSLNNAMTSTFIKVPPTTGLVKVIVGAGSDSAANLLFGDGDVRFSINGGTNTSSSALFSSNKLYSFDRTASNDANLYIDGVQDVNGNNATGAVPNQTVFIGANNNLGDGLHADATISTFSIGAAIGFDQVAHNTNVRNLLIDLGIVLVSDSDAQAVVDQMVNPTQLQGDAINAFIIASKAAGNWDLMDEFACMSLGDVTASNGLLKWKSLAQMTANGGVTFNLDGANFNGTNGYLASGFTPSVDGVNYTAADAAMSCFVKSVIKSGVTEYFMGGSIDNTNNSTIGQQLNNFGFVAVNGAAANGAYNWESNQLAAVSKTAGGVRFVYTDGIATGIASNPVDNLTPVELHIGGSNFNGAPGGYYEGILSKITISAATSFDHAAHNTNVRNLLISIGAIIIVSDPDAQAVVDQMVNITQSQGDAINAFIIAEKASGNWALMDDFACGSLGDVTASNGLLKWKSLAQMTANGGVTVDLNGWNGNGTNAYIDSGFNPSIDGVKYLLEDAMYGVFVKQLAGTLSSRSLCGFYHTAGNRRTSIFHNNSPNLNFSIHGSNSVVVGAINADDLVVAAREPASTAYLNGINIGTAGNSAIEVPPQNMMILAASDENGTAYRFSGSTISSFVIGGGIGFDHAAHNTNVRNLLTNLGLTL